MRTPPRSGEKCAKFEVLDVDPLGAERLCDPGEDAGPVGDVDAQALELARLGEPARQHPLPVPGGFGDPAGQEARVARRKRGLELLDAAAVVGERRLQLVGVVEEDVHPDPRVGAGHARHVAERAAGGGERLVPVHPRRARLVDEQVRERVRQVARQRDEPVVRARVDGDRRRAEAGDEPVHEPVALGIGLRQGREEPGRAFEQVRARVLRAACLGAADRVPADEARRAGGGRADGSFVEPTSVTVHARRAPGVPATTGSSAARPARDDGQVGAGQRVLERAAASSTAPRSTAAASAPGSGS